MKKVKWFTGGTIAALMMLTCSAHAASSSIAHWSFDEGVGKKLHDSTGNYQGATIKPYKWAQGVHNGCAQLAKAGINVGHSKNTPSNGTLTIQSWIQPYKLNYSQHPNIIQKDGSYALGFSADKSLTLALWLNGKKQTFKSKNTNWGKKSWTHVAATFDGGNVCLYINGNLDSTTSLTGSAKLSQSNADCFIGSVNDKKVYSGAIDELKLESKALSSKEIAEIVLKGNYEIARRENRFTDFYEKNMKRSAKAVVRGTLWIDTEDFDDYGGWWMDTQFVPQMGSPYLIAPGVGKPVKNAKTTVTIPEAGTYKLWVRNKNWMAEGYAPGTFAVSVKGKKSETTFGTGEQRAWIWQDGGTFKLNEGNVSIELEDLTGYYGRCDALILTKDLKFTPRQEQKDYRAERNRFVEAIPTKDMGYYDVIVVGAGVAGCNAAIAAARKGVKVALIQDRAMVGGNNSAELGVPVSGGSSSGKGRETGLNEEIGRIHAFNYLSKWATGAEVAIANEPNISLYLNSHVFEAETSADKTIKSVTAFNMIDGHLTRYTGDMFIDCTGDGWLGYYAGAESMFGRESKEMFGESNAKDIADNITMSGSLFQNSVLGFQAIDKGKPTTFDAPIWVYDFRPNAEGLAKRPKFMNNKHRGGGWWHENHGRNDDLWDPEFARDDLLRVSISYFDWVKRYSPLKEKAQNFEMVYIPITNAKRETRRLIGDHILIEQDMVQRRVFPDRVGYFVWKLDVHHPLGIFSNESPYDFETNFEPASMPFRMLYSKDIPNMLMAGRHVSVSHVALGTARVQGTTGIMGQVVGTAAAMCIERKTTPRGIYQSHISELQQQLIKDDVTILHMGNEDSKDLAQDADVTASSQISLKDNPFNVINGQVRPLDDDMRMWINKVPSNMWISDPKKAMPQWINLKLHEETTVNSVYLTFDTHLKEKRYTTQRFEQKYRMPAQCVRDYQVQAKTKNGWKTVADIKNNYQRRRIHRFPAVKASDLRVQIAATNGDKSARIYEVRAYNE